MKKKPALSLFDMNPFILFCVIFSVTIVINGLIIHGLVLGVILGEPFYLSIGHLLDSAVLSAVPVVTLVLFGKVPFLKYFNDDERSPWISIPAHYIISSVLLMLFGLVLTISRAEPVPPSEYLGLLGVYTQGYIIVVLAAAILEFSKIASVNNNLKKIQEGQKIKNGGIPSE